MTLPWSSPEFEARSALQSFKMVHSLFRQNAPDKLKMGENPEGDLGGPSKRFCGVFGVMVALVQVLDQDLVQSQEDTLKV